MTATICPTITASTVAEYSQQLNRVLPFAGRIHIDVMDGTFARPQSVSMDQLYWPGNIAADIHVMYKRPFDHEKLLLSLHPELVIVHAEAEGDFLSFAEWLHGHGMEAGVALQPHTPVSTISPAMDFIDHVLIFSGNLGHQGGMADLGLLEKVSLLRKLKPALEIGWDGGVNISNAKQIANAGVDVLNVGGAIHYAANPSQAYATIVAEA